MVKVSEVHPCEAENYVLCERCSMYYDIFNNSERCNTCDGCYEIIKEEEEEAQKKSDIPELPDEIMKYIMNINKERERDELYKKRYDIVITQMNFYFEEIGSDEYIEEHGINVDYMFDCGGEIRADTYTIEEHDLENTSYYEIIAKKHGGIKAYEYWYDNYY